MNKRNVVALILDSDTPLAMNDSVKQINKYTASVLRLAVADNAKMAIHEGEWGRGTHPMAAKGQLMVGSSTFKRVINSPVLFFPGQ